MFNTDGQEEGTIRVEFIPRIRRRALQDITPVKSKFQKELDCDESLSDTEVISDSDSGVE